MSLKYFNRNVGVINTFINLQQQKNEMTKIILVYFIKKYYLCSNITQKYTELCLKSYSSQAHRLA